MNDRSTVLRLIAVMLGAYGIYIGSYVFAMVLGQPVPLLLIGFVLQMVCAFGSAVGVWRGESWAAGIVLLLAVSIAATWLVEAFVFGIVGYLYALMVSVLAIVVALIIAGYVKRQDGQPLGLLRSRSVNS